LNLNWTWSINYEKEDFTVVAFCSILQDEKTGTFQIMFHCPRGESHDTDEKTLSWENKKTSLGIVKIT
jgi:hypothetical protein